MPDIFVSPASPTSSTPQDTQTPPVTLPSGKSMPFFATMFKYPVGITFSSQHPDETIVLFLRRDFITNFLWLFITAVLLLVPIVYTYFSIQFGFTLTTITQNYLIVGTTAYYLLVLGYALFSFLSWFYNISLLTTQKVIDIDYTNLLSKHVSETIYAEISDVKYSQNGFLQSFFDYGTVTIQTQDPEGDILFESVPQPGDVARMVNDLKGDAHA